MAATDYAFLVVLALVSSTLVFGGVALVLRRRSELGFRIALGLLALAIVASFVPAPTPPGYATLAGTAQGEVELPVAADAGAPVSVSAGGEARLEGDALVLRCPQPCAFAAGTKELALPPYKRGVSLGGGEAPRATIVGGRVHVEDRHGACIRVPLLIATFVAGSACAACSLTEFDGDATGPLREGRTLGC